MKINEKFVKKQLIQEKVEFIGFTFLECDFKTLHYFFENFNQWYIEKYGLKEFTNKQLDRYINYKLQRNNEDASFYVIGERWETWEESYNRTLKEEEVKKKVNELSDSNENGFLIVENKNTTCLLSNKTDTIIDCIDND